MTTRCLSSAIARSLRLGLAGAALALALPSPALADAVRLGGTGSALGTMALLAQAYRKLDPSFRLEVVPNLGSSGGVKALIAGSVQIAATSRAPKPAELAAGLHVLAYGRTPFVVATAKDGVGGLTRAQIAALYAGRATRWADGQPVRLVLRPANDIDTELTAAMSPQIAEAVAQAMSREGMVVGMTDQDAVDAIERLPGGVGASSLAVLLSERRRARALAVDGVEPTAANLASGRYPYAKSMYLLTGAEAPAAVRAFAAFVGSEAGRRILAETGHAAAAPVAPAAAVAAAPAR